MLAVVAAALAVAALLTALRGQTITVTHGLILDNRPEVEQWFAEQFPRRARLARWATGLLGCAGLSAIVSLVVGGNEAPTLAVTRTADTVTVDVTFRGLDPDQIATARVTVDGQVVAVAAFGPGADGMASRTLTVAKVPVGWSPSRRTGERRRAPRRSPQAARRWRPAGRHEGGRRGSAPAPG